MPATLPAPGQIARVRQRLYLVEQVVPPARAADSTLIGLSCIDDDAQGQHLEVLWEREIDAEVRPGEAWDAITRRGFIAQGFVHHDLSRACLAQTTDAIPRAILLGRLCLYGPGAARLHEEIIPITARWTDPKIRKIERELLTEPNRVASLYQVQATRIEPVGLVYLWPATG